jgi:hypothetical protein
MRCVRFFNIAALTLAQGKEFFMRHTLGSCHPSNAGCIPSRIDFIRNSDSCSKTSGKTAEKAYSE